MCNKCDCEANRLREELSTTKVQLLNILAYVHRDGGHYTMQHGIERSVDEAIRLTCERSTVLDEITNLIPNTRNYNGPS
jgi:hypothetical protein